MGFLQGHLTTQSEHSVILEQGHIWGDLWVVAVT
jgi:hypothetical protein